MTNVAETLLGGFFVSVFVACVLYGITLLQTFIYFQKYPHDVTFLKIMVAAICTIESIHTAFSVHVVYNYFAVNFGNFENAILVYWGVGVLVILEVVVSALVQAFYVYRIWILSNRNLLLTFVLGFLTFCRLTFGIVTTVLSYSLGSWPEFRSHKPILITIGGGLGDAALVDILLAAALSYYLMRGRQSRPRSTQNSINAIMLYTVNTGALTGITSVVSFVVCMTQASNVVFLGLLVIETKLYANSFLGSLNARNLMRNKGSTGGSSHYDTSFGESTDGNGRFRSTFSAAANSHITSSMFDIPPSRQPRVEVYRQTAVTDDMGIASHGEDNDEYAMHSMKSGELV